VAEIAGQQNSAKTASRGGSPTHPGQHVTASQAARVNRITPQHTPSGEAKRRQFPVGLAMTSYGALSFVPAWELRLSSDFVDLPNRSIVIEGCGRGGNNVHER
jgi:hypothetical protein